MEPKFYQFSRITAILRLINFVIFFYFVTKPFILKQPRYWMYLKIVLALIMIYWLCEWIIKVGLPLIKRRPALELSEEGLIYRLKMKAIRWDEVKEIKPASPGGFKLMRIILKNGKKLKISTSEIDGGYEIYQNIVEYFNNSQVEKS